MRGTCALFTVAATLVGVLAYAEAPAGASTGIFSFAYESDPGDLIGGGTSGAFAPPDATFLAAYSSTSIFDGFLGGNLFGRVQSAAGPMDLDFRAPPGEELLPGIYEDASSNVSFEPGQPTLRVGSPACTTIGDFEVLAADFAPSGFVRAFHATFELHCIDATESFRGEFRFEVTEDDTAPTVQFPQSHLYDQAVSPDDSVAVSFNVGASDDLDPRPVISCIPASGDLFPVGDTTVECDAIDASGNVGTDSFLVTVLPPIDLRITVDRVTVNPLTGQATVQGKLRCSPSAPLPDTLTSVVVIGSLQQSKAAGRNGDSHSFFVFGRCDRDGEPWTTTGGQRFAGGPATLTALTQVCPMRCAQATLDTRVAIAGTRP